MTSSARLLLDRLVDYAGLFPPAALSMPNAVASYAASLAGPRSWMLGRFVVPASRLAELVDAVSRHARVNGSAAWPLSILVGPDVSADVSLVTSRLAACDSEGIQLVSVEVKADTAAAVAGLARELPAELEPWFEIAPGPALGSTLQAIAATSGGAKMRMGGVTPGAFPSTTDVARFVMACAREGVRFKATAGLHHALRGRFRVTHADDSPRAAMHGFLNVFLAAALARDLCRRPHPEPEAEAEVAALLDEADPGSFDWQDAGVGWRSYMLGADAIADSRARLARSFGSCSFDEPVADLARLALIDDQAPPIPDGLTVTPVTLDATHNPDALSWVPSANAADTDFPIQNLPFGVFCVGDEEPRVGIAIGHLVLDVAACHGRGLFSGRAARAAEACATPPLNGLMALGRPAWTALRVRVSELLRSNHPDARTHRNLVEPCLVPMAQATLLAPAAIGDFSDFYASIHHATNVGSMLRPDQPLLPNYKHVPIGYHGRASSIVVSGTPIRRPHGQVQRGDGPPVVQPTARLDYELEVGFFIGPGNAIGEPIAIDRTDEQMFGVCLVNDWSARDVQQWEYQPLGPFLAKSFATSISPWVVTLDALEPYRAPAPERPPGDPDPLPYLDGPDMRLSGTFDVRLEVWLTTGAMREVGTAPLRLSASNLRDLYWTPGQLVAHHSSNGCNLRPGDLLASGTVSGPTPDSRGCLLELTWRGTEPIRLPTGEERRFLEDGDEVTLRGYAVRDGRPRIGLGECRGVIVPAEPVT